MASPTTASKELPDILQDPRYLETVSELRKTHGHLLKLEREGKLGEVNAAEQIVKLRLNCSLLYSFMNKLYERLNEQISFTADFKQTTYEDEVDKSSVNMAKNKAHELARRYDADIAVTQNNINQIRNEINRFEGIIMAFQSALKSEQAEGRV